jgi:hypothetical protein
LGKLYRIWSSVQSFNGPHLAAQEYDIIKTTPCGVWIRVGPDKKFVLSDSHKRFAYPTLEEAKESFIARKRKYLQILEGKTYEARQDIEVAQQQGVKIDVCPSF